MKVVQTFKKLIRHGTNAVLNIYLHPFGKCSICGYRGPFYVPNADKAEEEAFCPVCRSINRHRKLASLLLDLLDVPPDYSAANSEAFEDLTILDCSGMGPLARFAGKNRNYIRGFYSETGKVPKKCRFIDIMQTGLKDSSVDIVITEDVLEHVPDLEKALEEIQRILKTDGFHIFTVPYDEKIKTRKRVTFENDTENYILDPQYHWDPFSKTPSLVVNDLGHDFGEICKNHGLGFETLVEKDRIQSKTFGSRPVYLSRKLQTN